MAAGRFLRIAVVASLLFLCPPTHAQVDDHAAARAAVRDRDYSRAASIWTKLASGDDAEAQYRLATLSRTGRGLPRSHDESFRWMARAAEREHPAAQYELSRYYQNGWGTQINLAESRKWLARAAQSGHEGAAASLREDHPTPERLGDTANDPTERLAQGVRLGERSIIRQALAEGADPNTRNRQEWPLLLSAVQRRDASIAAALLHAGADPGATGPGGETALHLLAAHDDAKGIRALARKGAPIDALDSRSATPLHRAAGVGSTAAAQELIAQGAKLNAQDSVGRTALDIAELRGQTRVAALLRKSGAMRAPSSTRAASRVWRSGLTAALDKSPSHTGWTPLAAAAWAGELALVRQLIDSGADINEPGPSNAAAIDRAARQGHAEVIELLLSQGANASPTTAEQAVRADCLRCVQVLIPRVEGLELGEAARLAVEGASEAIALLLLKSGAPVDESSLKTAVERRLMATIPLLVRKTSLSGRADALCLAARTDATAPLRLLLEAETRPEGVCRAGDTPVQEAAKWGSPGSLAALVRVAPGTLSSTTSTGETLAHLSAASDCAECLKALPLDVIKIRDSGGRTPLMVAAAAGRILAVNALLEMGVERSSRDREGRVARDYAEASGHADVSAALK